MEQSKIWSHFQNEEVSSFKGNDARLGYIAKKISSGESVLNIGIGNGALEHQLLQKKCNVYALDPDEKAIDRLRKQLQLGEHAKVGKSQSMPFQDKVFDVVVMSEVLEHLEDDAIRDTMSEIKRVLKTTGRFIGTVPAEEILKDNEVICPCCATKFHRWGHVQTFNKIRLQRYLDTGFDSVMIKRKYFVSWSSLNIFGKFTSAFKRLKCGLGIKGSGENFFFIARG